MKLLVEKNILTSEEQDKFNKLKAGSIDKRDAYFELAKQRFGNDPDFDAYQTVLVDTFEKYGTDTSINRFLQFVVNKSNVDYNLTPEKAELVNNILINNESAVRTPAKNFWLYNPQSYNGPLYKIKALAFLSEFFFIKFRSSCSPKLLFVISLLFVVIKSIFIQAIKLFL